MLSALDLILVELEREHEHDLFAVSTPALVRPACPHPGTQRAMRDRIGAGVLRCGRQWAVFCVEGWQ